MILVNTRQRKMIISFWADYPFLGPAWKFRAAGCPVFVNPALYSCLDIPCFISALNIWVLNMILQFLSYIPVQMYLNNLQNTVTVLCQLSMNIQNAKS